MRTTIAALLLLCACKNVTSSECEEIIERCHDVAVSDNATVDQRECHESAEAEWTAADCTSNHARCFALCPEEADGGSRDGG